MTCNNCREGSPKCFLGQLSDPKFKPRTIQIDGRPAQDIVDKFKGNPIKDRYKIMIIGDLPRKDEDLKGIPFVGQEGDFLVRFLKESGIPIDDTFITNAARCKAPKNRKPSSTELRACREYLLEDLKRFQPEVIILLGNIALTTFKMNKDGGITNLRGKIFRKKFPDWDDSPEFTIVPTVHPATFLYRDNKSLKNLVTEDFRLAATLATGVEVKRTHYQAQYKVCKSLDDVSEAVQVMTNNGSFGFDTESPDLDYMKSPMRLLQLSAGIGKTYLVPFYSHDPEAVGEWKLKPYWADNEKRSKIESELAKLFLNSLLKAIGHNTKYDYNVVKRWLNLDILCELHDTAILHHLIYEYPPHSLKALADFEFQVGDWEAPVREVVGGEEGDSNLSWDHCPDEVLWPYGANDAELTYRLFEPYWNELKNKPHLVKLYHEESIPLIHALRKAEWMGNKIDLKKVDEMEILYKERLEEALIKCRELSGNPGLNPQSPDQVAAAFRALGPEYAEKVNSTTKSKGYAVGKEVLLEIDHPLAAKIMEYRKYGKLLSTYVNRVREDIDETGRVRYSFNITGTTGGRLSCRFLHQIPRIDKDSLAKEESILRQIFIEDEGFDIVYGDYSLLELCVFAYKSGEADLIRALENKEDIHRITAAAALSIPSLEEVSELNRSVGKILNFGTLYGSQGGQISKLEFEDHKTKKRMRVGFDRAKLFIQNFLNKYRKVKEFLGDVINITLANGCIYRTEFGREKRVSELASADSKRAEKIERDVMSFSIQSPAGAITLRTVILMDKIFEKYGIGSDRIRLINTVHDSISYGCKRELTPWLVKTLKLVAERQIPELGNKSFRTKIGVGDSWASAEMASK